MLDRRRSGNSITTREAPQQIPIFLEALTAAIPRLKVRLQENYQQAYPDLGDIIAFVIKTEELEAWRLSPLFPHLVLPALVEEHMTQLGLQVVADRPEKALAPSTFAENKEHLTEAVG
jgi:hypothetical protein